MTKNTRIGTFNEDASGLWHYSCRKMGETVDKAVADALDYRPSYGNFAAWFWFNGTPAPILIKDSPETLERRWIEWRSAYQTDSASFLKCLDDLKLSRPDK